MADASPFPHRFLIGTNELILRLVRPTPPPALAFTEAGAAFPAWQARARERLAALLGLALPAVPAAPPVVVLRETEHAWAHLAALRMDVDSELSLPAYLLTPARGGGAPRRAVLVIHGHGDVAACLGAYDDYHHAIALRLAQAGHAVLCPELPGFGALVDLAAGHPGARVGYWRWGLHMAYSLVTDAFHRGATLLGETVADLLRWEAWIGAAHAADALDVVGISYGGDLALTYPVFSARVARIFASGTLGSFDSVFARGYNAPAHCVPGILRWLDRADIAGLNAPRPLALHYGALDVPGPDNYSASYNETVPASLEALRRIYAAAGAPDAVTLLVSPGLRHELDVEAVLRFLRSSG